MSRRTTTRPAVTEVPSMSTTRTSTRRRVAAAAAGALATGLLAAGMATPAQAALTTSCSGTAGAGIVDGALVVPAGQSCDATGLVVRGAVTVRQGATLLMDGGSVSGAVTVATDGYLETSGTTLGGEVRLNGAFGASLDGSDVQAVRATGGGFVYSTGSDHRGDLRAADGETVLESSVVTGAVTTTGGTLTDLYDSWVSRGLSVTGPLAGAAVCESEVDGTTTVRGAQGLVSLGDAAVGECGANFLTGDLVLRDNVGGVRVSDTVVRGAVRCVGNEPAPMGTGNRFRGSASGQCAELPEPVAMRLAAAPADRSAAVAAVADRAAGRAAAGAAAAAAAGPAAV